MLLEFSLYTLLGCVSGLLAGMLGIGGGVILVPGLFYIFSLADIEHAHLMHLAIGTSLASMLPTTTISTIAHQKHKNIDWSFIKHSVPSVLCGSLLGAYSAKELSSHALQIVFGGFILIIGCRFFFKDMPQKSSNYSQKLGFLTSSAIGVIVSFLSALLGIGGGLFTVPILESLGSSIRRAISTSAAFTCIITYVASLNYFLLGLKSVEAKISAGFIYLPAVIIVGIASSALVPLGVYLSHRFRVRLIQLIFASVLSLVGVYMIVSHVSYHKVIRHHHANPS